MGFVRDCEGSTALEYLARHPEISHEEFTLLFSLVHLDGMKLTITSNASGSTANWCIDYTDMEEDPEK